MNGDGASGLWCLLFTLSKVIELLDTMFVCLKGRTPIFLHWYAEREEGGREGGEGLDDEWRWCFWPVVSFVYSFQGYRAAGHNACLLERTETDVSALVERERGREGENPF